MRELLIKKLQGIAPLITSVTATSDMGFEFSAIVPQGVIYPEPGMLINYSGGTWPLDDEVDLSKEKEDPVVREFLLDETWNIIPWADLSDSDLQEWLETAQRALKVRIKQ